MDASNSLVTVVTNGAQTAAAAAQTAAPASNAATAAATGTSWLPLIIWAAVILGIFFFLWQRGYLVRIRDYVSETQEELKKCTWPSTDELKGSTVVVMVTILLLGVFTVSVDWVLSMVIRLIT